MWRDEVPVQVYFLWEVKDSESKSISGTGGAI